MYIRNGKIIFFWTEEEDEIIRKHYKANKTQNLFKLLPTRSEKQIRQRANKLGLKNEKYCRNDKIVVYWSEVEDQIIRKYYKTKVPKFLIELLPTHTWHAIRGRANILGVRKGKYKKWEQWEIKFLLRNYGKKRTASLARTLKRSEEAVVSRAAKLGLQTKQQRVWTKKELEIVKKYYPDINVPTKQIAEMIGCTEEAVRMKAMQLKIKSPINYTKEDIRLIKKNKNKTYKEISKITGRGKEGIRKYLYSLGFKKRKRGPDWTEKEEKFIRDNYHRMPPKELAKKLSRPVTSVRTKAHEFKLLSVSRRKTWSEDELEYLKENYDKPVPEIAAYLGRTESGVLHALDRKIKKKKYFPS